MNVPLPVFIAIPLVAAFVLPVFGRKGKGAATILANLATISLLVLAVASIGRSAVYEIGKWSIPLGINLVLDGLSSLLLLTVSVISAASMLFSVRYMEQYTAKSKYLSLFMLMVAGMNGLVLSGDIFNLFVFLEIASLASYALVGFGCEHEELEASFKYMVLGSIASIFILFGIALVYGNTGALNMAYISKAIQASGLNAGLGFALCLFIVGFGLKAALVPFHAWLPDAHPSAPAPISAMLSGVLIKTLGVYALVRVIFNVFGVSVPISWVLIVLGLLSMIVGVFLAVGQWDFKRLLAYHSISQMGYVMLGIGLGALILAKGGNIAWASLAILGGLFHLVNHAVFKSLLFLTSGSVQMATGTRYLKELGGLADRMPVTRATCTVASASIAGIPPFNGFWSKLILVVAAVQAGFWAIAAVTVLVSLVTLISFLKVQRYVFLGELPENLQSVKENKNSMLVAMIFLACLCVLMGLLVIVPSLRANILDPAVKVLTDGLLYSANLIKT
ncbi:MAG: proton-conducting transporter membrane subunit [Phycisphaerae bacterium]|nr:proton-conducting transporter membrane subunit [Phycisphaerae bacterium]MDD5381779.1 proton-conducting transporter membrane subunit [Phycisphaerae bacterium]